ncbi:GFA family protein [Marinobacter salicampi]|uniref:GFA family protein n=1 Tax=Marinobacter salicampi TaxID=435907 RepID=UPI001F5E60CC|nr:GFA family protein [Marinobacter salicampi]
MARPIQGSDLREIMVKGECLCGQIQFEIDGALPNLYQCHCSLCRKATGAAANAATFVDRENFRWVTGEILITSFQKPSGYRSDFCSACGSPVPNQLRGSELMWVPAGLLQGELTAEVAVHLHLSSSASWERDSDGCLRLEAGPENFESLQQAISRSADAC